MIMIIIKIDENIDLNSVETITHIESDPIKMKGR
jgi:hypothetical protein